MTTTTNHYDLIVLGSDVAGLVAAALVARRGKRVLVIPHGAAEGTYRLAGRPVPLSLTTAPVLHMGTPPVQRAFAELGLLQQVRRQHDPIGHLYHLVLPEHRLDLRPMAANFDAEAEREWPGDPVAEAWALCRRWCAATDEVLEQLLSSDNALVADGFWGRRFLGRVADQLPGPEVDPLEPLAADHPLRVAARAVEPWIQHLSPVQLGRAAQLRIAGLWGLGPQDLPTSEVKLRELLLQRIELHSGEVKRELRVAELMFKRGRVVGVSLLGKQDRYGCDHMIIATDPTRLLDGPLDPSLLPKPLLGSLSMVEPVAHRFVMHLEIEERGLSAALDRMAICLPKVPQGVGSEADGDSADAHARGWSEHGVGRIYVRLFPGGSDETRSITITKVIAAGSPLDHVREEILDELDERGVLPFCRPYLRFMHSPHDGLDPTDGLGQTLREVGSAGALQQPMEAISLMHGEPSLGVGVLPHSSGIKSLYFACRLTLPGLGLEGEFAAGTMAASLVANPARSPFSRSPLLSRA